MSVCIKLSPEENIRRRRKFALSEMVVASLTVDAFLIPVFDVLKKFETCLVTKIKILIVFKVVDFDNLLVSHRAVLHKMCSFLNFVIFSLCKG